MATARTKITPWFKIDRVGKQITYTPKKQAGQTHFDVFLQRRILCIDGVRRWFRFPSDVDHIRFHISSTPVSDAWEIERKRDMVGYHTDGRWRETGQPFALREINNLCTGSRRWVWAEVY